MTAVAARFPYIGITGFMSNRGIDEILSLFPKVGPGLDYSADLANCKLMVGILVSEKTMYGGTNKWPNRYPKIETISEIVSSDQRALNLVHFNTSSKDVFAQMLKVHQLAGMPRRLDGFQLNIAWPEVKEIEKYCLWTQSQPRCKWVVLQVGQHAIDVAGDPKTLAKWVRDYAPFVDYILLDPSGGYGKSLDPEVLRPYLYELYADGPKVAVGIAGGLCAGNLGGVADLLVDFPHLSIDAEGRLRDENDHLDKTRALDYVADALVLYR